MILAEGLILREKKKKKKKKCMYNTMMNVNAVTYVNKFYHTEKLVELLSTTMAIVFLPNTISLTSTRTAGKFRLGNTFIRL